MLLSTGQRSHIIFTHYVQSNFSLFLECNRFIDVFKRGMRDERLCMLLNVDLCIFFIWMLWHTCAAMKMTFQLILPLHWLNWAVRVWYTLRTVRIHFRDWIRLRRRQAHEWIAWNFLELTFHFVEIFFSLLYWNHPVKYLVVLNMMPIK
jgi:hypothetical protein